MNLDNYIATPGRTERDILRIQLYEMERRADSAAAALYQARAEREALLAALRGIAAKLLADASVVQARPVVMGTPEKHLSDGEMSGLQRAHRMVKEAIAAAMGKG